MMNPIMILAMVMIVAGILALAYGGFSYAKETHNLKLGPVEMSIKDKETVNVPIWGGVGRSCSAGCSWSSAARATSRRNNVNATGTMNSRTSAALRF